VTVSLPEFAPDIAASMEALPWPAASPESTRQAAASELVASPFGEAVAAAMSGLLEAADILPGAAGDEEIEEPFQQFALPAAVWIHPAELALRGLAFGPPTVESPEGGGAAAGSLAAEELAPQIAPRLADPLSAPGASAEESGEIVELAFAARIEQDLGGDARGDLASSGQEVAEIISGPVDEELAGAHHRGARLAADANSVSPAVAGQHKNSTGPQPAGLETLRQSFQGAESPKGAEAVRQPARQPEISPGPLTVPETPAAPAETREPRSTAAERADRKAALASNARPGFSPDAQAESALQQPAKRVTPGNTVSEERREQPEAGLQNDHPAKPTHGEREPAPASFAAANPAPRASSRAIERAAAPSPVSVSSQVELLGSEPPAETPAREIVLRLPGLENRRVDLKLQDQSGELRVAVRTPDVNLTRDLREGISELVGRLELGGFRTETWKPAESASLGDQDRQRGGNPESSGDHGHGRRQDQPSEERRDPREREPQPKWVEELEGRLKAWPQSRIR